jgi:hypothetical protein
MTAPVLALRAGRTLRGLLQAGGAVPAAEAGLANAVNLFGDAIFSQLANEVRAPH